MLKKFRITVDGRTYNVAVEELPSDGMEHPHVPIAPQAHAQAPVQPHPSLAAEPAASPASFLAMPGDELAPLAGVVDSIEVTVGGKVQAGDRIAVIEAMKMKTDVFAKHSGTVSRIAVSIREGVETGQVLLTVG